MTACLRLFLLSVLTTSWLAAAEEAGRGMWVYKTDAILESTDEQQALFSFCKKRRINVLFWQVHFDRSQGVKLKAQESAHAFLKAAHHAGLRVHTLGGDPAQTFTKNHERVLAMVDAVVEFNHAGEPFDGMHLDIEPHALPSWKTSSNAEKCELLAQLVDVHAKAAARLHAADPLLQYGADIVFWLDKVKPDGSATFPVTYRGETKDAAKLLLDVCDNVGIMSYRDQTEGSNGIIALVQKTIASADTARGRAYVGVKMADIGPKKEGFFGRTETDMMTELRKVDDAYQAHRGYAGLCFFTYEAFKVMLR